MCASLPIIILNTQYSIVLFSMGSLDQDVEVNDALKRLVGSIVDERDESQSLLLAREIVSSSSVGAPRRHTAASHPLGIVLNVLQANLQGNKYKNCMKSSNKQWIQSLQNKS